MTCYTLNADLGHDQTLIACLFLRGVDPFHGAILTSDVVKSKNFYS